MYLKELTNWIKKKLRLDSLLEKIKSSIFFKWTGTTWFAIANAIFSLFLYFESKNNDYKIQAIEYKPELEVNLLKVPVIDKQLKGTIYGLKSFDSLTYNLGPTFVFQVKNTGKNTASILAAIFTDTLSGENILRSSFLKDDFNPTIDSSFERFYSSFEIKPFSIDSIAFKKQWLRDIKNNVFSIHLMVLYENELGTLYDLYYQARFSISELMYTKAIDAKTGIITILPDTTQTIQKTLQLIDSQSTNKIYFDKSESKKIIKRLQQMEKMEN